MATEFKWTIRRLWSCAAAPRCSSPQMERQHSLITPASISLRANSSGNPEQLMHRFWRLAMIVALMCASWPTRGQSPVKFTEPPKEESEQIKGLIDKAAAALDSGKSTTDI